MQKGSAQLFLIIGALVIAAFLGILFFKNSKTDILSNPGFIPQKQPETKDYSNTEFGFEFKYVKDLSVKTDSEEEFNKRNNGDNRKNFKGYVGYEPGIFFGAVSLLDINNSFNNSPFTVWIFNNNNNLTIQQWFDKYWYYPFVWGVFDYTSKSHIALDQEATISGREAKYKIVTYQNGKPKFVYVSKDQKMYLFRIIGSVGDQILSTFRFLNKNAGIPLGPESEAFFDKVGKDLQKLGTPSASMMGTP